MTYQAGHKLGNYHLIRQLGRGGFAEVYLGKHIYLNTQAAIKVLQVQLSNEVLEKFLHEARLIASLEHPHIVRVLEFGIEEHRPFLVMSYAPRGTLRRYVSGPQAPAFILPYVKQAAAALQYAHERKIVHRDVKPENMLLSANNTILLSDFGLAVEARSSYYTNFADSAGTIVYMSPEQLRGKPCAASDQYALGVVMYEWLCGALPFNGPDVSIVVQHFHEPPPSLREQVPTLSPAVEAVVLKALEKVPQKRFDTIAELARAFEEACREESEVTENVASPSPSMQIAERSITSRSVPLAFSEYEQISSEAVGGWQAPSSEKLLPLNDQLPPPALDAQQLDKSSIRMPSLPASLVLSGSPSQITEPDSHFPASPALRRPRLSRRAMLIGIVGAGMVLGGAGLWDLNSKGLFTTDPWTQVRPDAQGTTGAYLGQTPGTEAASPTNSAGSGNTASASSNKSTPSASSAVTSTPSTTSPTHTPTAAPDSASGTGSTPQATPTATPAIHISAQSMVAKGSTLSVSVTTNMGSVAFQLIAVYSGLKNAKKQVGPDQVSGTTNSSGNALVNWTPSLPSGQITRTTIASLRVEARDKNNNTLSSQVLTVSITR